MSQLEEWIYIGFAYLPWVCGVVALLGVVMGIIQKMIGATPKKWLRVSLMCTGLIGVWFVLILVGVVAVGIPK